MRRVLREQWQRLGRVDAVKGPESAAAAQNVHEVTSGGLRSVTVSIGLKGLGFQGAQISRVLSALLLATGQRPRVTYASRGVAQLGIRKGALSGAYVTLRGPARDRFLGRLVSVVRPRRALGTGKVSALQLDRQGNLRRTLATARVFPELEAVYLRYPRRAQRPIDVNRHFRGTDAEGAWKALGSLGRVRG